MVKHTGKRNTKEGGDGVTTSRPTGTKGAPSKYGPSQFSKETMLRDIKKVVKAFGPGIMKASKESKKIKEAAKVSQPTTTVEDKASKKSPSPSSLPLNKTTNVVGANKKTSAKTSDTKQITEEPTKQEEDGSASDNSKKSSLANPLNKGTTLLKKVPNTKDTSADTTEVPKKKLGSSKETGVAKGEPSSAPTSDKRPASASASTVKLVFSNAGESEATFKRLIQNQVSTCGPYLKCLLGSDGKGVVIVENEAVAKEYMTHFNGYELNGKQMSVSMSSRDASGNNRGAKRPAVVSKEPFKSLTLVGIPQKYDHDAVAKALQAVSGATYKSLEKVEGDGKWKVTFDTVPECVKFSSLINGCIINLPDKDKVRKVKVKCESPSFGKKAAHAGRVFVQNLPFNMDASKLESLVLPFDKNAKVNLPGGNKKGFAFVQFSNLQIAEKVISKLNGSTVGGRNIRLALSLPTEIYSGKTKAPGAEAQSEDAEENNEVTPERNSLEVDISEPIDGDCLAVVVDSRSSPNADHMPSSGVRSQKASESDRTIFVRNLSFESTDDALKEYFSGFGAVESCKICRDAKGTSRGTAFVLFENAEDVQKILSMEALALERDAEFGVGTPSKDGKKVKHSAAVGIGFSLHGRRLRLSIAVSREQASAISKTHLDTKERASKDKKGVDLLMEGVIEEKSPEFKELTAKEQKLQIESLKEKLEKMKNPNMFLNPKRLCVRNLPPTADVNKLRTAIATHFRRNVDLSKVCGSDKVSASRAVGKVTFLSDEKRKVTVGASTMRRRMPFAFIDFEHHELALQALRFLSGNADLYGAKNRLFAEFAIEDSRAIYIQKKRKEQYMAKLKEQGQSDSGDKRHNKRKTYSRGKLQRMKRRTLAAAAASAATTNTTTPQTTTS